MGEMLGNILVDFGGVGVAFVEPACLRHFMAEAVQPVLVDACEDGGFFGAIAEQGRACKQLMALVLMGRKALQKRIINADQFAYDVLLFGR